MTKFSKYKCPKCNNEQLEPNIPNSLIQTITCRNCWNVEQFTNILGSK